MTVEKQQVSGRVLSSEQSADFHQTKQLYIPEERTLHNLQCECLKSYEKFHDELNNYQLLKLGMNVLSQKYRHFRNTQNSDKSCFRQNMLACYLIQKHSFSIITVTYLFPLLHMEIPITHFPLCILCQVSITLSAGTLSRFSSGLESSCSS